MRLSTTKPLRYLPLFAVASTLFAVFAIDSVARADVSTLKQVGDIRLGVYYIYDDNTRSNVSSTIPSGGLDYTVAQSEGLYRTNLGVDYIQRSSGGTNFEIIPVTISEQYYHTVSGTNFTPYGEAGIGVYFVHLTEPNNPSLANEHSESGLGGFIGGGVDLTTSVFLDVRYHIVPNVEGQNPSGFQFTAGLRF
jgi:outer membrane protein W